MNATQAQSNLGNYCLQAACAICRTTQGLLRCAKCKTVHYCSAEHQHMHWPQHKQECRFLAKQKNNQRMQKLQQAVAATNLNNRNNLLNSTAGAISNGFVATDVTLSPTLVLDTNNTNANAGLQLSSQQQLSANNSYAQSLSQCNYYNVAGNDATNSSFLLGNANEICRAPDTAVFSNGFAANMNTNATAAFVNQQASSSCVAENMLQSQTNQQRQQYSAMQQQQQTNQQEKNSSYQIGNGDDNPIGLATERRYEELCSNIIKDMNEYGLSVVDDFLGQQKGLEILNEVHQMYSEGVFKDGQLVNNQKVAQDLRTIRGDKITWVKGHEPGCNNVGFLINQIDAVIFRANTMLNNGKLGNYNIKERTKAMVACYPGSGSHYVMHVDNPNKDGRVITAIYYLNVDWDTQQSGGVLRIFPENVKGVDGPKVADIEPKFDRLIFFWSDKRNPHEVQPAYRTRYAITVWYFDANEREAALNRCRQSNSVSNNSVSASSAAALSATTSSTNPTTSSTQNSSRICNAEAGSSTSKNTNDNTVSSTTNDLLVSSAQSSAISSSLLSTSSSASCSALQHTTNACEIST